MDRFRFTKAQKSLAKKALLVKANNSTIQHDTKITDGTNDILKLRNNIVGVSVRVADDGRASKQKLEQLDRLPEHWHHTCTIYIISQAQTEPKHRRGIISGLQNTWR